MKGGLSGPFLLLLLLLSSTVSGLGSVVSKCYTYIKKHFSWQDAQSYCRKSCSDLAVMYNQSDADGLYLEEYSAWIGLHKNPPNYMFWVWSDGSFGILWAWAQREPGYDDGCAYVYYKNRKFYGTGCESSHFFICHKRHPNHFEYVFIPQSKTWSEAQQYCRDKYHDLATLGGYGDLNEAVDREDFPVWTGLHRDGETWRWSTGLSDYRNWSSDEPGNKGDCVSISSTGKQMATQNCSARFPFICFRDNLVLVKENKTWEEALEHCRALESPCQSDARYELVSVQPGDDHGYVTKKVMEANTEEVWAGLRFLAGHWLWVNGADVLYSDLPLCPLWGQHCGALSKNDRVETRDCSEKRNFLCYTAS